MEPASRRAFSCARRRAVRNPSWRTPADRGAIRGGKSVSSTGHHIGMNVFFPPTPTRFALRCRGLRVNRCPGGHPLSAVRPKSVMWTSATRGPSEIRHADIRHPWPVRKASWLTPAVRPAWRPEDADLLVARDTAAQGAQVSRVSYYPGKGVRSRTPIYGSGRPVSALSHSFGGRVLYLCRSSFRYGFQ